MKKNINSDTCPNLFNLLTLTEVLPSNTHVYDMDSDTWINLNKLIANAYNELTEEE